MYKELFVFLLAFSNLSFAAMSAINSGADHRIKVIPYIKNEVVNLLSHYGYSITITYAPDEVVYKESIATGDSLGWHLLPLGNTLVIKPAREENTTNLNVRTNKRDYHYVLKTLYATSPDSQDITFAVNYTYPGEENRLAELLYLQRMKKESTVKMVAANNSSKPLIDSRCMIDTSNLEYGYTYSGDIELAPTQIFDDGKFTYMKFGDRQAQPAVFAVDRKRNEWLVNFSMDCGFMVIEQLGDQFTLRFNDMATSIFKEKDYKNVIEAFDKTQNIIHKRKRAESDFPYADW